jgi:hypothetical protein
LPGETQEKHEKCELLQLVIIPVFKPVPPEYEYNSLIVELVSSAPLIIKSIIGCDLEPLPSTSCNQLPKDHI